MDLSFDAVYYEKRALDYPLGKRLLAAYGFLPWHEIESHNRIPEFQHSENRDFTRLKRHLVIGIRKTHRYVENHKVSDFLVPYTSSGCRAMCLYCYLVCNYNKCAYLRLFVNREQMMERLLLTDAKSERALTFEIGSNSDLVMENAVTGNLPWTIETFARAGRGRLTFPTKFENVEPLLALDHRQKVIFRMSVNPEEIIRRIELGTSPLAARIRAANAMSDAGYPVGLLIAPVILIPGWEARYAQLIDALAESLSPRIQKTGFIEIIFMTYSYVQNAINADAFPGAETLFDKARMTGSGRGKYRYSAKVLPAAEAFLRERLRARLGQMTVLYVV